MSNHSISIQDKVIFVTGALGLIGYEISKHFLGEGAKVVLGDINEGQLNAKQSELEQDYQADSFLLHQLDITSDESIEACLASAVKRFGRIDVLINNAGITKDNLLMRMGEDDFDKVIEVNLKSVFNMTKAVQRTLLKQRQGSIINMSSVVGVKGNAGQTNYAASKAGMIGFTKSVALELGSRNIRCNAIAPGFIETEMTDKLDEKTVQGWRDAIPLKRGGSPEDVANACLFLASDLSAYVTGQVLNVDGGMLT